MNYLKKTISSYLSRSLSGNKLSFSQSGEDMIVAFILNALNISDIRYLDIGAHHPSNLSNTYHFYLEGCTGVCIEPNPDLCKLFQNSRPKDTLLNVGVGVSYLTEADYFIMSTSTLNTFSRDAAKRYEEFGLQKIQRIIKIPLIPIKEVIRKFFPKKAPHFVSLDVEGIDLEILQSFDFSHSRPEVFCVETLTYSEINTEEKISGIIDFMVSHDYMLYADTYINSIFVNKEAWHNRGKVVISKAHATATY